MPPVPPLVDIPGFPDHTAVSSIGQALPPCPSPDLASRSQQARPGRRHPDYFEKRRYGTIFARHVSE